MSGGLALEPPTDEYERRIAERRRVVLRWIRVGQVGWVLSVIAMLVVVTLARRQVLGPDVTYPVVGSHVLGGLTAGFAAVVGLWNRPVLRTGEALMAFGPWLVVCGVSMIVVIGFVR